MKPVKQKKKVSRYTPFKVTKKSSTGIQEKKDQSVIEKRKDEREYTDRIKYWPIFNQTKLESQPKLQIGSVCSELQVAVEVHVTEDCKKTNSKSASDTEQNSNNPGCSSYEEVSNLSVDSQKDNPEDEPVINVNKLLSELTYGCYVRDYPVINASKLLDDLMHGCYVDLEEIKFGDNVGGQIGFSINQSRKKRKFESPRFTTIFESQECFTEIFPAGFSLV